jgi:hypothetical protein
LPYILREIVSKSEYISWNKFFKFCPELYFIIKNLS